MNGLTLLGIISFVLLCYFLTQYLHRREIRKNQSHKPFKMKYDE